MFVSAIIFTLFYATSGFTASLNCRRAIYISESSSRIHGSVSKWNDEYQSADDNDEDDSEEGRCMAKVAKLQALIKDDPDEEAYHTAANLHRHSFLDSQVDGQATGRTQMNRSMINESSGIKRKSLMTGTTGEEGQQTNRTSAKKREIPIGGQAEGQQQRSNLEVIMR